MARVNAELVRPVSPEGARLPRTHLLWGFLFRAKQSKLYLHSCTPAYCLKNRAACRFFFPWPRQEDQQYDEETDRIAFRRRYPSDDQWVVPHNLELMAFSPATVNVLLFDPQFAADHAR